MLKKRIDTYCGRDESIFGGITGAGISLFGKTIRVSESSGVISPMSPSTGQLKDWI